MFYLWLRWIRKLRFPTERHAVLVDVNVSGGGQTGLVRWFVLSVHVKRRVDLVRCCLLALWQIVCQNGGDLARWQR